MTDGHPEPASMPAGMPARPPAATRRAPVPSKRRLLRTRFTILALLAILLAGYLAARWSRQADIADLHTSAARRLANLSAALFAPIEKFSYLPEVAAEFPLLGRMLAAPGDAALVAQANDLLMRLNRASGAAVVYALDRRGIVVASSNWQEPDSFVGKDYSFRPYFKDALQGGSGSFYGMGTTSLLPGYYLSRQVRYDTGHGVESVGVVVVKIDMSRFDSNWKNKDEMAVTDAAGVIFLSSKLDWKYRPLRPLPEPVMRQMKRTRQYENALRPALDSAVVEDLGVGEQLLRIGGTDQQGVPVAGGTLYFVKTERLHNADWSLQVLTPVDEIDARARRTGLLTGALIAFIALLALYIDQVRTSGRDRERARVALQEAHDALAEQHRQLQTVSETLRVTSTTDPLTSAYNRRYFFEAMDHLLAAQRRTDSALSIVMIDVDHFKDINDRHGHPTGDRVLQILTRLAQEVLRDADLFARFGGEEFIIALPNATVADAYAAAERLRERTLDADFDCDGTRVAVRISCGVAQHRNDAESIEETIRRADAALYQAKQGGRNRVAMR